jgi:hypothetical protein
MMPDNQVLQECRNTYHSATLHFDLSSVDGECAFRDAIDGYKYKAILSDLDMDLRNRVKHNTEQETSEVLTVLDNLRSRLHEMVSDKGVSIND